MAEVLETTDMEVATDIVGRVYASAKISVSSERPRLRVSQSRLGPVVFDRTYVGMTVDFETDPMTLLYVNCINSGTARYTSPGDDATYGPGDVCVGVQPGLPFGGRIDDLDTDLIGLEPNLLSEVAEPEHGVREPVKLLSNRPYSPAAGRLWRSTHDLVRDSVGTDPDAWVTPLMSGPLSRLLAATALATFPNTAQTEPTIEDRHDAHLDTVHRAVGFIESTPDLDIGVTDIARAAHVSIRALQLAFRRHLDVTPMQYLRRVRLDLARADLLAADPTEGRTVTEIAMRHGFSSPSRFAADYRAAYGEHPHTALAHAGD